MKNFKTLLAIALLVGGTSLAAAQGGGAGGGGAGGGAGSDVNPSRPGRGADQNPTSPGASPKAGNVGSTNTGSTAVPPEGTKK
jgi:hypothetical protein